MVDCTFENGNKAQLRHVVCESIVVKGGKALLTKRSLKVIEPGKWALPGGYAQMGETMTQAAERETLEETGWEIEGLTLLKIRDEPVRPGEDRQNIVFIYFCTATEEVDKADWETDEVRWFSLDELPPKAEMAFDQHDSLELYKKYLEERFTLPLVG